MAPSTADAPQTVTVSIDARASGIMTCHRPIALTVTRAGERLTGAELCAFAGIDPRPHGGSFRRDLPVEVGGHDNTVLCIRRWDDAVAWLAGRGIGTGGWVHVKHGRWVPAGSPDAPKRAVPAQPCAEFGCGLPAGTREDTPELCGRHAAAAARRAAHDARRAEEAAALRAEWAEQGRAERAGASWAQRIRDDFAVDVGSHRGRVTVDGEGLWALLSAVRADAPWLLEDGALPHELRIVDRGPAR